MRQWLMSGVSYMIPFVAAGGILIALSFLFGGAEFAMKVNGGTFHGGTYPGVTNLSHLIQQAGYAGLLFKIGETSFAMLVPILAGFIRLRHGRPDGHRPRHRGGPAGQRHRRRLPRRAHRRPARGRGRHGDQAGQGPAGPVGRDAGVVIPLVSTLVVGALTLVVLGRPIASAQSGLTGWLNGMSGANAILFGLLLGLLLGAMMAFDMGGPVNKVAYTFGLAQPGQRQPGGDGGGDGGRHDPAAGDGPRDRCAAPALQQGRAHRRGGRLAARGIFHHRRARSPSPPPARCGPSPRPWRAARSTVPCRWPSTPPRAHLTGGSA